MRGFRPDRNVGEPRATGAARWLWLLVGLMVACGDGEPDGSSGAWGEPVNLPGPDVDCDGLSDPTEQQLSESDPRNPDTDADHFGDGWEVGSHTDPIDPSVSPVISLPEGPAYRVFIDDIERPASFAPIALALQGEMPPLLAFFGGLEEGLEQGTVRLVLGVGRARGPSSADPPSGELERYDAELSGFHDPVDGELYVSLAGAVVDEHVVVSPSRLDLSFVRRTAESCSQHDITLYDPRLTARFSGVDRLSQANLVVTLRRDDFDEAVWLLGLPTSTLSDNIWRRELDPDGDGLGLIRLRVSGYRVDVVDYFVGEAS